MVMRIVPALKLAGPMPSELPFEAGKLPPSPTRLAGLLVLGAIVPGQEGFRRGNRRRRHALAQASLGKLAVSGKAPPRMLRKLVYVQSIVVRRLTEHFAVIANPVATMLLVDGHRKQTDTIPIVIDQRRPHGLIAASEDTIRLLNVERRNGSVHDCITRVVY